MRAERKQQVRACAGFWHRTGREVLIFGPSGIKTGRVELPASASRVTHVAIKPGTRDAFVTASGPGGGYIYTFTALAPAPAGSPNGG